MCQFVRRSKKKVSFEDFLQFPEAYALDFKTVLKEIKTRFIANIYLLDR